jgi:hypothetical protein
MKGGAALTDRRGITHHSENIYPLIKGMNVYTFLSETHRASLGVLSSKSMLSL